MSRTTSFYAASAQWGLRDFSIEHRLLPLADVVTPPYYDLRFGVGEQNRGDLPRALF